MPKLSAFKHSTGTWSLGNCMSVVTDFDEELIKAEGDGCKEFYGGFLIAESILKEADAKLIAAAPDLLDACLQILSAVKSGDVVETINGMSSAQLAINKAGYV